MADREVNILIRAKDQISGVLASASEKVKEFGGKAADAAKTIAAGFAAAAGALGTFGKLALDAYSQQEDAERGLAAALSQVGQDVDTLLPRFKAFASAVQRVTTVGDETTLSMMALGKNLGIPSSKLEEATTAAIGLSKAFRIDLEAAMTMVGKASQGNTDTLGRYGIVLDATLTDAEKFAQVLQLGADKFSIAEAETRTFSGTVKQMKNAYGDALESIGAAIVKNEAFVDVLDKVRNAINAAANSAEFRAFIDGLTDAFSQAIKGAVDLASKIKTVLAPVLGTAADVLRGVAAFGGTLAGGGTLRDAVTAARNAPQAARQDTEDRLARARAQMAAEAAAAEQAQRIAVEDTVAEHRTAKADDAARKSAEAELREREKAEQEIEKQRADAAKRIADLDEQMRKADVADARAADDVRTRERQQQQQDAAQLARAMEAEARVSDADRRRRDRDERRQAKADAAQLARAMRREARGQTLTAGDRAAFEAAMARQAAADAADNLAQDAKTKLEQEAKERAAQRKLREDQLAEQEGIVAKLGIPGGSHLADISTAMDTLPADIAKAISVPTATSNGIEAALQISNAWLGKIEANTGRTAATLQQAISFQ